MKKNIIFLFVLGLTLPLFGANSSPISCSDSRLSGQTSGTLGNGTAYQCQTCFDGGNIYYRAGRPIENITGFYDSFKVQGTGTRVMWQDEIWIDWDRLNAKFDIGSSLTTSSFLFSAISVSDSGRQPFWQTAGSGEIYGLFYSTDPSLTYVSTPNGISLDGVASTANSSDRNKPMWRIAFNGASHEFLGQGQQGAKVDHVQCEYIFPRFCGDGTKDTDKGEICDDGNMNNGDGCNNVCQPEVVNLTCDNLTISPATLTQSGGSLTATCDGTNETQYKFILKQGTTVVNTIAYQNSNQATFSIPANTGTSGKPYSVECQVKNANESDKTSAACMKALTVPGTEPICLNLNVTPTSVTSGGDITYSCSANNATSYSVVVKNPDNSIFRSFTSETGSFTLPANPAGSYSVACYINGQTSTPSSCQKTVTNTIPEAPVCTNLSVTKNGTSVEYNCTGTGPITSYTIQRNGTTVSANQSGSLNLGYGTHTLKCFVNNSITSNACEKTVTIDRPIEPEPRIEVIKDDDDNHDDRQNLEIGDDARFSILVRNNGSEGLENLTLNDPRAPECNRSSNETRSYIRNVGNRDEIFDPGESFTYTCRRNNVSKSTFPSDENNVCVYGRGRESRRNVEDCDKTRIYFDEEKICEFMRVDYDRVTEDLSQVQVSCSPTDGYRLGIVKNGRLMDRLTSPIGEFDFELEPGNYSLTCLRDGEDRVRSDCTKKITIQEEEQVGECRLRSSARFGGAPLRTRLTCETPDNNDCRIGITRNGRVWDTINDCDATLTFDQPGSYEAVCILDGNAEERCSTSVVVDTMTKTPTGPGAFIALMILALSGAGYVVYRRRKAA